MGNCAEPTTSRWKRLSAIRIVAVLTSRLAVGDALFQIGQRRIAERLPPDRIGRARGRRTRVVSCVGNRRFRIGEGAVRQPRFGARKSGPSEQAARGSIERTTDAIRSLTITLCPNVRRPRSCRPSCPKAGSRTARPRTRPRRKQENVGIGQDRHLSAEHLIDAARSRRTGPRRRRGPWRAASARNAREQLVVGLMKRSSPIARDRTVGSGCRCVTSAVAAEMPIEPKTLRNIENSAAPSPRSSQRQRQIGDGADRHEQKGERGGLQRCASRPAS